MLKKWLSIYFILVLSWSAVADEAQLQPLSPAGESLQQELLSGVKTLDRRTQLYHYFRAPTDTTNAQQINPYLQVKANRDGWLNYFFGFRMGAFWDPNNHVTEMTASGPGMYFAIDPSASREFGESAVVLSLPAGMKYLSVAKAISIGKRTRELLVKENIISKDQLSSGEKSLNLSRGFSADTLKNFVREENSEFRKLVTEIFNRNKIVLVEYSWKSFLDGFCKTPSQSAFVLIGLQPDPADDTQKASASDVLASMPEEVKNNFFFFSDFEIPDLTGNELHEKDVLGRFRHTLTKIKEKGSHKAKKYIEQNLNDEEVNELAEKTYRCERRY
ncbi:MAG: hypothetical protein K0R29_591 [Pseudobdellovibrio sp.]|jgi:hypothetical protein|nr:hypothetical protein [Pseudobdellovibrio sp.]